MILGTEYPSTYLWNPAKAKTFYCPVYCRVAHRRSAIPGLHFTFTGHCQQRCGVRSVLEDNGTVNTLRPRQNGRHVADDIFKWIFLNENVRIAIWISLKFVSKGPINTILALVRIMAWRWPGDKPLSEPMMVRLPTHICVTWPQWVNSLCAKLSGRCIKIWFYFVSFWWASARKT